MNKDNINDYKKIQKQFSFAYKDGHEALDWLLEQVKKDPRETNSNYVVKLLLEDKRRKTSEDE